jgi:hypothetical protein
LPWAPLCASDFRAAFPCGIDNIAAMARELPPDFWF